MKGKIKNGPKYRKLKPGDTYEDRNGIIKILKNKNEIRIITIKGY